MVEAITREEKFLAGEQLTPITRKEMFLAKAAGMDVTTPTPITRKEMFLSMLAASGGGGGSSDEEWFNDGDTHIWITLQEGRTSFMLSFVCSENLTVDWGDGTEPETVTSRGEYSSTYTPVHNYENAGDYVIRVTGKIKSYNGNQNYGAGLISHSTNSSDKLNNYYKIVVRKIEMGCSAELNYYAFCGLVMLQAILLSEGVPKISSYVFRECTSLIKIKFPKSVNTIEVNAFSACYGIKYLDFTQHDAVPSIGSDTVFDSLSDDFEIRVPAALYDEWIAAVNWSTYASNIVAV